MSNENKIYSAYLDAYGVMASGGHLYVDIDRHNHSAEVFAARGMGVMNGKSDHPLLSKKRLMEAVKKMMTT